MRKSVVAIFILSLALPSSLSGVSGKQVRYAGGTLDHIPENAVGYLEIGEQAALFASKDGRAKINLPYAAIDSLEYGQKVGRRVGAAIVVHPLFLFSKKRKHFLTVGFTDEQSKHQGAIFELSKGMVLKTLKQLEERTGKQIAYESDEARNYATKN